MVHLSYPWSRIWIFSHFSSLSNHVSSLSWSGWIPGCDSKNGIHITCPESILKYRNNEFIISVFGSPKSNLILEIRMFIGRGRTKFFQHCALQQYQDINLKTLVVFLKCSYKCRHVSIFIWMLCIASSLSRAGMLKRSSVLQASQING